MTDIAARYRKVAGHFAATTAAVPTDRWSAPSPCEGWSARDVVGHAVDVHRLFLGFVGASLGDIRAVDDDPVGAFSDASAVMQRLLDDPVTAAKTYEGFFGTTSFEASVDRFVSADLVVHRWDLARAAGLDETMDREELQLGLVNWPQFGEAMRTPSVCGPALEPPPGADDQTRLLAFLGRKAW